MRSRQDRLRCAVFYESADAADWIRLCRSVSTLLLERLDDISQSLVAVMLVVDTARTGLIT